MTDLLLLMSCVCTLASLSTIEIRLLACQVSTRENRGNVSLPEREGFYYLAICGYYLKYIYVSTFINLFILEDGFQIIKTGWINDDDVDFRNPTSRRVLRAMSQCLHFLPGKMAGNWICVHDALAKKGQKKIIFSVCPFPPPLPVPSLQRSNTNLVISKVILSYQAAVLKSFQQSVFVSSKVENMKMRARLLQICKFY